MSDPSSAHSAVIVEARPSAVVAIKLPADLAAEIKQLAECHNATKSSVMRAALRVGLPQLQHNA